MLVIRLQRVGKKHQPSYRLVVAERRSKLGGPPAEDLGSYNPFTKVFAAKKERVLHWLKNGAQPSVTAHNLLLKNKVIEGNKMRVYMKKKIVASTEATATPAAAA
jgi:small subunit ribosomal protein S16